MKIFRVRRISLLIGLVFLALSIGVGDLIANALRGRPVGDVVRESLLIGGWVAMWRPLEIFLYDWWPIRSEARLYDRLSGMPVRIVYAAYARCDAWRSDWPAISPTPTVLRQEASAHPGGALQNPSGEAPKGN